MKHTDELNLLIDKAAAIAGSDNKLAALIGTSRMAISDWRHDRRPCPPEDQALMAQIAGLDATQTLIRATLAKHEGKPKGDLLMKVLGKRSLATGAALGFAGLAAMPIGSMIFEACRNTMCIMLNI